MVKKFNLSEAAADILNNSVNSKRAGQDKPGKLSGDVAYGTKDAGDIGTEVTKTTDGAPQATKGAPTAKPPGATPPVGSEPMKKLKGQPAEEGSEEKPEGKPGVQKLQKNKGANFQQYEDVENDEAVIEEEKEEDHEDAAEDKKMIKKAMSKASKEGLKEDIDALLQGEELSEEFVSKATTIFEAAVISRTESILEDIQNELVIQFEEAIEEVKEDLATKVDDYMNYMAEEWMKENTLAVEKGLRSEIVEDFIAGLKDLFVEHYIDIPEEKVNVVEELTTRVEELESSLNEQINAAIQLKKELNEKTKTEAIHAVCEGLTQTQVEKMKQLAESVEFTSEEEFADKVVTLRESYFEQPVKSADSSALNEEITVEEEDKKSVSTDPAIAQYAQSISKSLVK